MYDPKEIAVMEINIKNRTVTLYEENPMFGQTGGEFSPLPPIDMKYAKSSPFGHIMEAALKMALVKVDNESSY